MPITQRKAAKTAMVTIPVNFACIQAHGMLGARNGYSGRPAGVQLMARIEGRQRA